VIEQLRQRERVVPRRFVLAMLPNEVLGDRVGVVGRLPDIPAGLEDADIGVLEEVLHVCPAHALAQTVHELVALRMDCLHCRAPVHVRCAASSAWM